MFCTGCRIDCCTSCRRSRSSTGEVQVKMIRHAVRRVGVVAAVAVGTGIAYDIYARDDKHARLRPLPMLPSPALCEAPKKKGSSTRTEPQYHAIPLPEGVDDRRRSIVSRFKSYATADLEAAAKFKKEKNGVKIYLVKEGTIPDPAGTGTALPFARVGEAIIKAPVEDVANLWWFFNLRKDWDKANTLASEVVEEYNSATRLVYIKGAAKPMISSRDFAFVSCKVPSMELSGRAYGTAFVQVNAPSAVPEANGAVRGNINSLLFLEPIDATTTRARYVVEVEPKGWLPGVAVEAAADDLPGTLGVIKAHLEGLVAGADERGLVERREHDRQMDHQHPSLVDSITATEEDLKALQATLKKRVAQLKKDERELGMPLTELRNKVNEDLRKVEARLKALQGRK